MTDIIARLACLSQCVDKITVRQPSRIVVQCWQRQAGPPSVEHFSLDGKGRQRAVLSSIYDKPRVCSVSYPILDGHFGNNIEATPAINAVSLSFFMATLSHVLLQQLYQTDFDGGILDLMSSFLGERYAIETFDL